MVNKATSSFEEEEDRRMVMALDGSSAYYDSDYFDMERGPGGPMGSFEQAISWLIGGFIAVALVTLVLLVGAGCTIWRFWPAGWRPW